MAELLNLKQSQSYIQLLRWPAEDYAFFQILMTRHYIILIREKPIFDMVEVFGYDLNDIRQFIINSIDGAFVDESDKKRWRIEWLKEFDSLRSKLEIPTSPQ